MKFNKILAIIETNSPDNHALTRAIDLANISLLQGEQTEVSILVIYSNNQTEDDAKEYLSNILPNRKLLNYFITEDKALDFILELSDKKEFDLLIKHAKQNESLISIIVTPFDWQLLRKCTSPILMVKSSEWNKNGKILVAVNVSDTEEYHEKFNNKLVDTGLTLSKNLGYDGVELVNAYPTVPVNVAIDLPEFNPISYSENVRGHNLLNMKKLRQKFSIPDENTHVYEGVPEEIIPAVAEKINANIVVLGTIGRSGLSAVFLGNTAEMLIPRLNCDLLTIKPDQE